MKRISIILVLILCLTLVFGSSCSKTELTKVKLNEVTHSVFYAPQYAALNLGFFKDEGLDVELTTGQGADKVMTAVLSGQSDIGFAGPEAAIYVYNEGKEDYATVFAQLTKRDGSFLMGRKANPDFKWSDVKGSEIIGGRKGGVPEMTLEYVLKKHNLIPGKDVNVDTSVQFALMAGAFTGGKGDYVTLFEPTASMVEKEGKGYILASVGKESGEIPYTAYFARMSYMKKNTKTIQKFTNAIYRGQLWVSDHTPEEVAKVIKPSFPDTSEEILITVAKRYQEIDAWSKDPVLKRESLELLQKVMQMAGELKKTAPYDKIVTTEYAEKAIKQVKK
jgi:NitT/TauT family transport system substrate-binding protein